MSHARRKRRVRGILTDCVVCRLTVPRKAANVVGAHSGLGAWMPRVLTCFLLLGACSASPGTLDETDIPVAPDPDGEMIDTEDSDDVAPQPSCEVSVVSIVPTSGERFAGTRSDIVVDFSAPLEHHMAWSVAVEGVDTTVELSADGMTATLQPRRPLAHETEYAVTAMACDSELRETFRTTPRSVSVSDVTDRWWSLGAGDLTWVAPGSSSLFDALVSFEALSFEAVADPTVPSGLRLEAFFEVTLDLGVCGDAVDLGPIDLSANPRFTTTPTDIWVPSEVGDALLAQVQVSGTYSHGGMELDDIHLQGLIDTRPIEPFSPLPVDVCELASMLGEPCVACPDGMMACIATVVTASDAADLGPGVANSIASCEATYLP